MSSGQATTLRSFDRRLINQQDRDVVLYRVDTLALLALQTLRSLAVLERLLVGGTNQNFQQIFSNHDPSIVRQAPRMSEPEHTIYNPVTEAYITNLNPVHP